LNVEKSKYNVKENFIKMHFFFKKNLYHLIQKEPNLRIERFQINRLGTQLRVISSGTDENYGWEHVSVSTKNRCPTWDEMVYIKDLFWREDETVIQFHPKKSNYKNVMPFCLHLWKKIDHNFDPPLPHSIFFSIFLHFTKKCTVHCASMSDNIIYCKLGAKLLRHS